ncbi:MAG: NAD(P) transhydrogenase subunit alpha [bacterium]|nr:NAD(P) transhydrogenase subunit alpha [bacterium]
MIIGVLKETAEGERRVGMVPVAATALSALGHTLIIEQGAGEGAGYDDAAYASAGWTVTDRSSVIAQASCIIKVSAPSTAEVSSLRSTQALVSYIYPKRNAALLAQLALAGVNTFSMDAMPRITRAQTMDVLSSQNNLAGYKAVIVGAEALGKIFPMQMTAAGTITPARVLIYGAGVAGLQAIATARRLGAVVEVTDIRPDTKEQVESLGAKFIMVEGLDQVRVEGGYVAEVSADLLARQTEAVNKSLTNADLVILTALVQGGSAPVLITEEQVGRMKRGAVIVDMATEAGGNCALSVHAQTVTRNGVKIMGCGNLASTVPQHASELYSKNIVNFIKSVATTEGFTYDTSDEVVAATLVVHNGAVR